MYRGRQTHKQIFLSGQTTKQKNIFFSLKDVMDEMQFFSQNKKRLLRMFWNKRICKICSEVYARVIVVSDIIGSAIKKQLFLCAFFKGTRKKNAFLTDASANGGSQPQRR